MKLPLLLLLLPVFSQAQTLVNRHPFPQQQVNEALQKGWEEKDYALPITGAPEKTTAASPSGIYHLLQQEWQGQTAASKLHPSSTLKSQGILYVGTTPHDTLVVTGTWKIAAHFLLSMTGWLFSTMRRPQLRAICWLAVPGR